ncbi:MAG: nucleotidyltransferase [Sedimentisphaerales bacterium]|jgi:predicted nucleotidyltransferase
MKNDFLEILKRLTENDVSFVIIGGFAATVYGCTLVTQDIDICCDFSPANLLQLQKALAGLHPVHRMTPNRKPLELTADNIKGLKNLYLATDLGTLDCIGFVEGIGDFEQVVKVSRKIKTDGLTLNTLTIDALIGAKEAMRRPRDRQAIIQLKAIREQINQNGK